jgi:pyruvate formate lyase activating enzyme
LPRLRRKRPTAYATSAATRGPQIPHALKSAQLAVKRKRGESLRICWETNGSLNEPYLTKMARLSLQSGGCVKVDLKCWDKGLHQALCGVGNEKTFDNFKVLNELGSQRPDPPLLIASTLLVPGYVDEKEVTAIARFLADLNPDIPYSLLGFHPSFFLTDLPRTSRRHALKCREVAREAGLRRVHIGNMHLLGEDY